MTSESEAAPRASVALPRLQGRALTGFRILWCLGFLAAMAAPIASFHFARVLEAEIFGPFHELGLRIRPDAALGKPLGVEARAQGVTDGARILRIDGAPVPDDSSRRDVAARLKAAQDPIVRLVTQSPTGDIRHHQLTRSRRHIEESDRAAGISLEERQLISRTLSSLAAGIALLAALLLFLRRPRDPVAALMSLGFLLLAATGGFASATWTALGLAAAGGHLNNLGLAAVGLALVTFPHGRFEPRWSGWMALFLISSLTFNIVNYHYRVLPPGIATAWTAAVFMGCLAVLVVRFRRLPPGMERQQIRWVLFGFALAIFAGAVSAGAIMLGEAAEREAVLIWAGVIRSCSMALVILFVAAGLLVSLLRYRLYDAEAAISRSAAVAVLTLALAAVYAGASKGMETYFETTFGRDAGTIPGAVGAALAVLLFLPLNSRIQTWAERRFQAPLLRLRRDLPLCLGDMRETSSLREMGEEALERLTEGVRARHAALVIHGEVMCSRDIAPQQVAAWCRRDLMDTSAGVLDCSPAEELFPMRLKLRPRSSRQEGELGWILLGPRPDGSFFGKDEREVLSEIVDPAARAIEIVLLREKKEAQLDARLRALENRPVSRRTRKASPRTRSGGASAA